LSTRYNRNNSCSCPVSRQTFLQLWTDQDTRLSDVDMSENIIPEIQLPPGVEHQDSCEDWDQVGSKGGAKVRLQRSHAIRDSTSPPPSVQSANHQCPHQNQAQGNMSEGGSERSTGSEVGDPAEMGGAGDAVSCTDSGRGDTDTPDGEIYTDNTGTDLTQFIISTLNKNAKDRVLMLKLEQEMSNFIKDAKKNHHKFPHMSSYHRMMVHRVAAYFGLDHNVDQSGNCVIVNKTKNTRLPDMRFKDHIIEDAVSETQIPMKLKLMKRESCSCESGDRLTDSASRRSKSIEEREEEYEKAKRRIFNNESNKVLKSTNEKPHSDQRLHCLASTKGANQARSFDIRESLTGPADRPAVSKSFSFGGYPAPQHLEPRKQHAASPQYYRPSPPAIIKGQVVWAVSDVSMVPAGSVLINPDTGTPYLNSDGSVYMFDPSNPPRIDGGAPAPQPPSISSFPSTPQHELFPGADLAKLSLEADQVSVGSQGSNLSQGGASLGSQLAPPWVVPASVARMPLQPAPYILVNPVSNIPLPQYIPYLSQSQSGPPGTPMVPSAATPLPPASAPTPPPARPLLFSLHRSAGSHSVILYLQHSPSLLTRAQLTSFLDSFLGPASPQLHGGHWQFLDHAGVWCDLASLPEGTPATNRFPIQIFFDSEEQAGPTLQALRQVGFLQLETSLEQLQQ